MAETNISANKITGEVIEADHVNELKSAIVTTLSGRNAAGTVTAGQDLGSATFPWGVLFADGLTIDGQFLDISMIASEQNIIRSGQVRTTSDQADFIRVDGATNEATIEAATTDLVYVVNGSTTTLTADILLTSLIVAASGASEQCIINDTGLTDQEDSKFLGGENDTIPVDTMGASISGKVGQVVCLQKGSELMLAFVKSTTELTNVKRGYFFDSSGDPIIRETLANNDILTLMSLGYVFLEDDAATFEVSYLNPIYSFDTPGSPANGQYWFDLTLKQWKRFNGSIFVVINRILIGLVVINTANAIGSRSLDFDLTYSDINSLSYEEFSDTTIISTNIDNSISVNANILQTRENRIIFDITTDRAAGVSETANTRYYAYISQDGQHRIDTERPYKLSPFLLGYYHPYQSWRCVASFNNDGSLDIESVTDIDDLIDPTIATQAEVDAGIDDSKIVTPLKLANFDGLPQDLNLNFFGRTVFTSSGTWIKRSGVNSIIVEVIGGGGGGGEGGGGSGAGSGGGGGAGGYSFEEIASGIGSTETVTIGSSGSGGSGAGGNGGTSSFGSFLSATGGAGGGTTPVNNPAAGVGGTSGVGLNGDTNLTGGEGGDGAAGASSAAGDDGGNVGDGAGIPSGGTGGVFGNGGVGGAGDAPREGGGGGGGVSSLFSSFRIFGSGGNGGTDNSAGASAGAGGLEFGGGGGGGSSANGGSGGGGGAGSGGIIIIHEYA